MSGPDGVIKLANGKYRAVVNIQDGHEDCGVHDTEDAARAAWKDGHQVLNHTKRKKREAALYEVQQVVRTEMVRIK